MAPRLASLFGVNFLWGYISLKKWSYSPILRDSASPFNSVCYLIQWKYTKSSLYGLHLRWNKPEKINYGRANLENSRLALSITVRACLRNFLKFKYSKYFCMCVNQRTQLIQWGSWLQPIAEEYTDVGSILPCVEFVLFCTNIFIIISFQRFSTYFWKNFLQINACY